MASDASAIVIGAGAFGSSVAFHLAKAGWRDVVLLDRHELASQTSPRAAGLTGQIRSTDLMTRLAMLATRKIERFQSETAEPLTYYQTGSLRIVSTPEHEAQLHGEVERGRRLGLAIDFLTSSAAHRMMPFLETSGIRAVTYTMSDLYLEPGQIPAGYARAAARLGATLLPNTAAIGIMVARGAVQGVLTDRGPIQAPIVVDAAGAWARMIGQMAGARLRIVPTRHQLLVTEPFAGIEPTQPIMRFIDTNVYLRPEQDGLMLGGYEHDPMQYDGPLAADFDVKNLPLDVGVLRGLADTVVRHVPTLRKFAVRHVRGGLPTMTPDGALMVGPVRGVTGFYVATGCCVGGLSISPAIGELLAEWIISGKPAMDLSLLAPDRFGLEYERDDALRAACRRHYAHHYWFSA